MLKGKGEASAFVISASESLLLLLLLDHVDLQRVGRAWVVALRAKHREQLMGKKNKYVLGVAGSSPSRINQDEQSDCSGGVDSQLANIFFCRNRLKKLAIKISQEESFFLASPS